MTGSVALWYERTKTPPTGDRAKVEVHFNLWRHIQSNSDSNFLDVGLLISDAYELKTMTFFVPAAVALDKIEDLSPKLRDDKLLSAVFNDVVRRSGSSGDASFTVESRGGKHFLTFHSINLDEDVIWSRSEPTNSRSGVKLEFNETFCSRLRAPGKHYVRLRFNLTEETASEFSTRRAGQGGFVASTLWSEEFTELRFNEMRNLPPTVLSQIDSTTSETFDVTAAHCFIIRDLTFELVASHGAMQKMRRMEANLWDGYLPSALSYVDIGNMMIYHWRAVSGPVENFVSLARFRAPKGNLKYYFVGVVLLGALGSAVEDVLAAAHGGLTIGALIAFVYIFTMILLVLAFGFRSFIFSLTKKFFSAICGKS